MDWLRKVSGGDVGNQSSAVDGTAPDTLAPAPPQPVVEVVEDAVYQLYAPTDGNQSADVVFFHGLQPTGNYKDAWLKTWQAHEDEASGGCWPVRLLSKEFPRLRILSVSYNSGAVRILGANMTMQTIDDMLVANLLLAKVGDCPLVLVGHSLGGIVFKSVCVSMTLEAVNTSVPLRKKGCEDFLNHLRGAAFYATPHGGARLADGVVARLFGSGPLVPFLKVLDENTATINRRFTGVSTKFGWPTLGFGETTPMTAVGMVVDAASAMQGMDEYVPVANTDHSSVCKPKTSKSAAYMKLASFIRERVNAEV